MEGRLSPLSSQTSRPTLPATQWRAEGDDWSDPCDGCSLAFWHITAWDGRRLCLVCKLELIRKDRLDTTFVKPKPPEPEAKPEPKRKQPKPTPDQGNLFD